MQQSSVIMSIPFNDILTKVMETSVDFTRFSQDEQQIDPIKRLSSIDTILDALGAPQGETVLDLGTGYGYGAIALASRGNKVIAVESNGDKLREGTEYWRNLGISFEIRDTFEEALQCDGPIVFMNRDIRNRGVESSKKFDSAYCFYVSEYMLTGEKVFESLTSTLKPGARFILTTEGPTKLPLFLRRSAVRILANCCLPQGMHYNHTLSLGSEVYDRHVVIMTKKD